jgi:hypothetical protein
MEGLTEGRIVHFVVDGWHRPAVITHVWDKQRGTVNLHVFPDGSHPLSQHEYTSVNFDESGLGFTWHWIEKA